MFDPDERQAYAEFLEASPDFAETAQIDAIRETDYQRLDATGQAYLDYTGAGLYRKARSPDTRRGSRLGARESALGQPHFR